MAKTDGMGNRFVLCVHDIQESQCLKCKDARVAALEAKRKEEAQRRCHGELAERIGERDAKIKALEAENGRLKAHTLSDAEWKIITDTAETLKRWSQHDFTDSYGHGPMWNPTLRRLRNLIAARAQQPNPAQDKEQG